MNAQAIDVHALKREHGGRVYDCGRRWVGPGPGHSRHDASLSVRVMDDGRVLIYSFAGDPFIACMDFLGIDIGVAEHVDAAGIARLKRQRQAEVRLRENEALAFCQRVWRGCRPIEGTIASRYFETRAIGWVPADLGFHPNAPRDYSTASTGPAVVALARSASGCPRAIQCTYLAPDGGSKRARATFGLLRAATVRLAPVGLSLAVGEGVETCASYQELEGVPAWATLGTANLEAFVPPSCVRHLIIAADGDAAGLKAAHSLAKRLRNRCDVTIAAAPLGFDWNDLATGKAHV